MIHIFNTANKLNLDISYEEMVRLVNNKVAGANEIIKVINSNENAKMIAKDMLNDSYIFKDEDGNYYLNDMLVKLELFNYNINHQIYKSGISITRAYEKNGIEIYETPEDELKNEIIKIGNKMTFKEAFLQYAKIMDNPYDMTDTTTLQKIQPLIVDAYNKLGTKKVQNLRYIKKNIEAALLNMDEDKNKSNKVAYMLKDEISFGFISSKKIIDILVRLYSKLGIKDVVKATAIEKYYECKATSKRIEGKVTKGYEIYRAKLIF